MIEDEVSRKMMLLADTKCGCRIVKNEIDRCPLHRHALEVDLAAHEVVQARMSYDTTHCDRNLKRVRWRKLMRAIHRLEEALVKI